VAVSSAGLALALRVAEETRKALGADGAATGGETEQAGGGALQAEAIPDRELRLALEACIFVSAVDAPLHAGQAGSVTEVERPHTAEAGVPTGTIVLALQGAGQAGVYLGFEVRTTMTGQTDSLGVAGGASSIGYVAAILGYAEVVFKAVVKFAMSASVVAAEGAVG
jgi:hypothetical protein